MQPRANTNNITGFNRFLTSAETELAADATPSNNPTDDPKTTVFGAVKGGYTYNHQVSHTKNGRPEGCNVLFMDGHVIFRKLGSGIRGSATTPPGPDEIQRRTLNGPYFWF